MRRRDALVIGGLFATAIAIPPILRRMPSDFEFSPMTQNGFAGFRRLYGGPTSGSVDPFVGVGRLLPDQAEPEESEPFSPCLALFGTQKWDAQRLPVAVFSDFNCPYCKGLEARLHALEESGGPIKLVWHEMPLLGQGSLRAARAALAGRFLGVEQAARRYLWTNPLRPGPVALENMAIALGISATSLKREVGSTRVSDSIARSMTLGTRMGVYGTPATVFGRTLVMGEIKDADITKLVQLELAEGPIACN